MNTTNQTLSVADAISQALAEEMRRDARVLMFGEGVATKRRNLLDEFGPARVRNTPLAEAVIAGTAVGAAAMGLRPVIDLLFAPFMTLAMDALVNSAGKLRYLSGGQFEFPLVAMAMTGSGWCVGGQHNHNLEAMFVHAPGLKVVMPSHAADFMGLLKSAIRDDNPVLFLEHKRLYSVKGPHPDVETLPIGEAAVAREGADLTIVSISKGVRDALQAADTLAGDGLEVEVVDLRSLRPLDMETVAASVAKTNRALCVEEGWPSYGVTAEIAARISKACFDDLDAPVERLGMAEVPLPYAKNLEIAAMPNEDRIAAAAKAVLG
jgi:pyruvate/2-oxoglutarate/acetoin dehydrogenase E1 component